MAIKYEQFKDGGVKYFLLKLKSKIESLLADKVDKTTEATDTELGLVKTNSLQNVTLDEDGKLKVGGRLGQMATGTGLFAPNDREPRNVNDYSFVITEAKGVDFATSKSLGVITGSNITLKKSASAGSTTYEVANNYANRIICSTLVGGYVALNEDWAKQNQLAKVLSVQINGADYTPNSDANSSANNIVITTETSANPDSATSTIRAYGSFGLNGYSNFVVGQNVSVGGNGTGAQAVIGASSLSKSNWSIVVGNGCYNAQSRSAVFGTNNINMKQNALLAGQGHDSTNGSNCVSAVGKFSNITANTLFAVGNGTSHVARKNAFEVLVDGVVLTSPNGTRYKVSVDDSGNLTTTAM